MIYFHGTPDSRLAQHPDDGLTARAGVRLVAVDRPGIGDSPVNPGATVGSVADDVAAVADHLGLDGSACWPGRRGRCSPSGSPPGTPSG